MGIGPLSIYLSLINMLMYTFERKRALIRGGREREETPGMTVPGNGNLLQIGGKSGKPRDKSRGHTCMCV